MEQGRMDALLPTASLLEQILTETDLGADLQQVARRDPAFRELARLEEPRRCLASRRSVLACCRLPFRPATSAGSARCGRTPAVWHSSPTSPHPVQPAPARSTRARSIPASHSRNDSRSAGAI